MKKESNTSDSSIKAKRKQLWALISVLLILIGVIGSFLIKTSGLSVQLIDIQIPTKDGTYLNATIFRPKSATADNPAPIVVAMHGYTDAAEKQDFAAIELSRRGVVVIEMNAYSHGLSSTTIYDKSIESLNKEARGMIAMVDFVANSNMDYIDKSQIGVTGHSMGGNSTRITVEHYGGLELKALEAAASPESIGAEIVTPEEAQYAASLNLIKAAFPQSALPSSDLEKYSAYSCNMGLLYSYYDEGAYRNKNGNGDMRTAPEALAFINSTLGESEYIDTVDIGRYYGNVEDRNLRVVYNPKATHTYQYRAPASATHIVEFFTTCFNLDTVIPATNHTFLFRYFFTAIALIGLALTIPVFISLLLSTKFFKSVIVEVPQVKAKLSTKNDKLLFWGSWAFIVILTIFCFVPIVKLNSVFFPAAAGMEYSKTYNSAVINSFSIWCIFITLVSLAMFLLNYFMRLKKQSWTVDDLGLKLNIKKVGKSMLLAVCVLIFFYNIVFLARFLFHTEFQTWQITARIFTPDKLWMFVQYLPMFFPFMLMLSLSTNTTNRIEGQKCNLLINVLGNIAGPLIILLFSFIYLYTQGVYFPAWAPYRDSILPLSALAAFTGFATIISRRCFEKTGSVWTGAFVNAFLITMIQVCNTATLLLLH